MDEIHERSLDSDFLLVILRRLMRRREDLRIILMSATLAQERFQSYFDGCPAVHIEGLAFPVEQHFLEDAIQVGAYCPTHPSGAPRCPSRRVRHLRAPPQLTGWEAPDPVSKMQQGPKKWGSAAWRHKRMRARDMQGTLDSRIDTLRSAAPGYSEGVYRSMANMDQVRLASEKGERWTSTDTHTYTHSLPVSTYTLPLSAAGWRWGGNAGGGGEGLRRCHPALPRPHTCRARSCAGERASGPH